MGVDFHGKTFRDARWIVEAKTANYTVLPSDAGKILTNEGATGAITFTLPDVGDAEGMMFTFWVVAGQNVTVASQDGDDMVAFNDAAADSVAFSTASELIGAALRVISTGTKWLCEVNTWDNGTAVTTATIAT